MDKHVQKVFEASEALGAIVALLQAIHVDEEVHVSGPQLARLLGGIYERLSESSLELMSQERDCGLRRAKREGGHERVLP